MIITNEVMVYVIIGIISIVAYLLGSVNSAIIVGKLHKIDIREHGSGNAGLTNTLRTLGKKAAVCVLLGDVLKGVIAIVIAMIFAPTVVIGSLTVGNEEVQITNKLLDITTQLAGLAVVLGHIFPIYYKFKGGKGVLTSVTVMFMINWKISLICLLIFIIVVSLTRYVSLGSILAALAFPCIILLSDKLPFIGESINLLYFSVILASIVIIKHRTNIVRLLKHEENKLSFKKKEVKTEN